MSAERSRILIHAAYRGEIQNLLRRLNCKDESYGRGFSFWTSREHDISIVISGEGKSKTEISLSHALARISYEGLPAAVHIVNLGVAGSLRDDMSIGQAIWVDAVYGKSENSFHPVTVEPICPKVNPSPFSVVSVCRVVEDPQMRNQLSCHANFVDMESHSVGLVARTFGHTFSVCKVVSDMANKEGQCQKVRGSSKVFSEILCQEFMRNIEALTTVTNPSIDEDLEAVYRKFHLSVSQKHQLARLHNCFRTSGSLEEFRKTAEAYPSSDGGLKVSKQISRKFIEVLSKYLDPMFEFGIAPERSALKGKDV